MNNGKINPNGNADWRWCAHPPESINQMVARWLDGARKKAALQERYIKRLKTRVRNLEARIAELEAK